METDRLRMLDQVPVRIGRKAAVGWKRILKEKNRAKVLAATKRRKTYSRPASVSRS